MDERRPVPRQNYWRRSPGWRHHGRCCQMSSSRNEADENTSETFASCFRVWTHKCIISWGLVRHIAHLGNIMITLKMIIFEMRLCRVRAHFALTVGTRNRVFVWLVVTTVAAIVMVVHVVRTINVVVVVIVVREIFFACFVIDSTFVTGDPGHELAWYAWGNPFKGPPVSWLRSLLLRRGNWRCYDDSFCRGVSIVVMLTTPSQRSCCVCQRGSLRLRGWSPRPSSSRSRGLFLEHFDASRWWHRSRPSWLVVAFIASIALPVVVCLCTTVPSSDAHIAFTARF